MADERPKLAASEIEAVLRGYGDTKRDRRKRRLTNCNADHGSGPLPLFRCHFCSGRETAALLTERLRSKLRS